MYQCFTKKNSPTARGLLKGRNKKVRKTDANCYETLVGVKANLSSYLKHFQEEFKVGSFDQSDNARRYLLGLLKGQTGKRNIERISEQYSHDNYQSLHHFISHSNWQSDAVRECMQQLNIKILSSASFGYIIDEKSCSEEGIKKYWCIQDSTVDQRERLTTAKQEYTRC